MAPLTLRSLGTRRVPNFDGTLREALHRFFWSCKGQPIVFAKEAK